MLYLKNPHSVVAALKSRPRAVKKIEILGGDRHSEGWTEVLKLAQENRVQVVELKAGELSAPNDRGHKSRGHSSRVNPNERGTGNRSDSFGQGRLSVTNAQVEERSPIAFEELLRQQPEKKDKRIWFALDCLQDPQNVGAIFRLAGFFGVAGILMTADRSVSLTSTVYDVASGGVECVPFSIEVNLGRAIEAVKDQSIWILGTSEHSKESLFRIKRDRDWMICLGNEEKGLRRLTQEKCDQLCGIPALGGVPSLNVSTAAAVVLTHLRDQVTF